MQPHRLGVMQANTCMKMYTLHWFGTGVMLRGQELQDMVNFCSEEGNGGIIDEAYEFFHEVFALSSYNVEAL